MLQECINHNPAVSKHSVFDLLPFQDARMPNASTLLIYCSLAGEPTSAVRADADVRPNQ